MILLPQLLKETRKAEKLSQTQTAILMKCSINTIHAIENNKSGVSKYMAERIRIFASEHLRKKIRSLKEELHYLQIDFPTLPPAFPETYKEVRETLGLTRRDLSRKLKISVAKIDEYESCPPVPKNEALRLARLKKTMLNVPVERVQQKIDYYESIIKELML